MNAKKLLSMLLSAAMAVTTLAGCGGGAKNYSNEAAKAANAAQSTVVFETDTTLTKSLQDALEDYTQTSDVKTAMVADENLKDLLTSGYQLDIYAAQGEDAEAAAQAIAQQYIVGIVSGKQSEGKIAMVLHDGNSYYYVAVLTYRTGSGSGSNGGGSSSGGDNEDNKPVSYSITVKTEGNGSATAPNTVQAGESCSITATPDEHYKVASVTAVDKNGNTVEVTGSDNQYTIEKVNSDITVTVTFEKCAVTGIVVKENPDQMQYAYGDTFNPEGMVITVTYEDGSTEDITTGYNWEKDELTPDNNEVTITYEGQTTEVTVTVEAKKYTVTVQTTGSGSIYLNQSAVEAGENVTFKAEPAEGWTLNSAILVNGNAAVSVDKNSHEVTVSNIQSDVTIKVSFKREPVLTGIYADPDSITYWAGETFSKNDLKIFAVYDNDKDNAKKVTDFTVKNAPLGELKAGACTLTVEYEGKTTTVTLNVKNPYVTKIEVVSDSTIYRTYGDTLFKELKLFFFKPYQDIKIQLTYSNDTKRTIDGEELVELVDNGIITTSPILENYNFTPSDRGSYLIKIKYYDDATMSTPATAQITVEVDLFV